jgi:hypothetical protein
MHYLHKFIYLLAAVATWFFSKKISEIRQYFVGKDADFSGNTAHRWRNVVSGTGQKKMLANSCGYYAPLFMLIYHYQCRSS